MQGIRASTDRMLAPPWRAVRRCNRRSRAARLNRATSDTPKVPRWQIVRTRSQSDAQPQPALRAQVVRNGFAESEHLAHAVVVDPDGSVVRAWGDPVAPHYPRSLNKPLQAAGMVRAGLALRGRELAIVAASHSGEPEHIALVTDILTSAGLKPADLENTPALPFGMASHDAWLAAGRGPTRLSQNCSGKHAGMLLTAKALGAPLTGYIGWDHPVQQAAVAEIRLLTGDPADTHGIDGCGAPVVPVTLLGLARAFSRLRQAQTGTPEAAVAEAMSSFPFYVAGGDRDVTRFMQLVPGAIAKDGAEGVHAMALPDGRAFALKVVDGAERARPAFAAALLAELGLAEVAAQLPAEPVLGGGKPVGQLEVELG